MVVHLVVLIVLIVSVPVVSAVGVGVDVWATFCAATGELVGEAIAWAMRSTRATTASIAASRLRFGPSVLVVSILRSPIGECSHGDANTLCKGVSNSVCCGKYRDALLLRARAPFASATEIAALLGGAEEMYVKDGRLVLEFGMA